MDEGWSFLLYYQQFVFFQLMVNHDQLLKMIIELSLSEVWLWLQTQDPISVIDSEL